MGSGQKSFKEDIEEYERLCEKYNEMPHHKTIKRQRGLNPTLEEEVYDLYDGHYRELRNREYEEWKNK